MLSVPFDPRALNWFWEPPPLGQIVCRNDGDLTRFRLAGVSLSADVVRDARGKIVYE